MRMKVFENSSHKRTRSDPRKTLWIVVSVTANFLTTHPSWLWFIPTSTRRQEGKSIFPTNQHQHAQKRPPAFKESKRKKTPKSTAPFWPQKYGFFRHFVSRKCLLITKLYCSAISTPRVSSAKNSSEFYIYWPAAQNGRVRRVNSYLIQ